MNIVHLLISGGIGGIETLTRDISKISDNNNIFYFLYSGGIIADELKQTNTVHIQNGSHKDFLGEAEKFTKFCKKQNTDVIIAHNGSPIVRFMCAYARRRLKGTKMLLYFHSNAYFGSFNSKLKNFLDNKAERFAFKSCDAAVAISETVKNSFVKKHSFNESKIQVIYNGIDRKRFLPCFDKDNATFTITYVGRVIKSKGIDTLIEAAALLNKPDIRLEIIGSASKGYSEQLTTLAKSNCIEDKITLCGAQNNVEEWLAHSNLLVHPSKRHEGFGLTLAEALSCGVPCVAFNEGAMTEIIENGKNGFIAEDLTAESLAAAIEKAYSLWKNNFGDYIEMCRYSNKSAEKFDIKCTVKALEALY